MNNKYITKGLEEFDKKYLDEGTPSGLNQKDFKNFPDLVNDIRNNFLHLLNKPLTNK